MTFTGALFDPSHELPTHLDDGDQEYVYHDPRIVHAINVALVTRRPLFVTGSPGSGKSALALDVARRKRWAYVQTTITSRTRTDDLVARFDTVRRLNDAQARKVKDDRYYLVPGVLWWAFEPSTAGAQAGAQAVDPRRFPERADSGIVVLLDEIDKAEPDLPNDLLGPLDRFIITPPGRAPVAAPVDRPMLVIITSNGERRMPPAFLRRCVSLELSDDDPSFFTAVATSHFGEQAGDLYAAVAAETISLGRLAAGEGRRRPSMAEYLDTLRACIDFNERPGSALWEAIQEAALRKTPQPPPAAKAGDD